MNAINPIIAEDVDFAKLLYELEQINLQLLVELKQQRLKDKPVFNRDGAKDTLQSRANPKNTLQKQA